MIRYKDNRKLFISEDKDGMYHWWIEKDQTVIGEGHIEQLLFDQVTFTPFSIDEWNEYMGYK